MFYFFLVWFGFSCKNMADQELVILNQTPVATSNEGKIFLFVFGYLVPFSKVSKNWWKYWVFQKYLWFWNKKSSIRKTTLIFYHLTSHSKTHSSTISLGFTWVKNSRNLGYIKSRAETRVTIQEIRNFAFQSLDY